MTPCLRPDEIIDVLDGAADPAAAAHVATCATCRATLDDVRSALAAVDDVPVPEPSPLFWSQINARVGAAIAAEPPPARHWWDVLRLDVLVPLAGLATLVVALAAAVGRVPSTGPAPATAVVVSETAEADSSAADPDSQADGALALVLDLVATLPDSEFDSLGVASWPDLGVAAQALSADEQRALRAILLAAVERPQS